MRNQSLSLLLCLGALALTGCGGDTPGRASTATKGDAFCTANEAGQALGDAADFSTATPEQIKTQVTAMMNNAQDAQSSAPTDIKPVVDKLVERLRKISSLFADYDYDFAALGASDEATALVNDTEANAAQTDLDLYLSTKCGIETN